MKKNLKNLLWVGLAVVSSPFLLLALFLLKNSVLPTWQSGSVSDWISTFSMFSTAVIAYKAYKLAPSWLEQNRMNDLRNISRELIEDDLPSVYKHGLQAIKLLQRIEHHALISNKFFIKSDLGMSYINHLSQLHEACIEVQSKLKKARRLNFVLLNEYNFLTHKIKDVKGMLENSPLIKIFYDAVGGFRRNEIITYNGESERETLERLKETLSEQKKLLESILKNTKRITDDEKPYESYFTKPEIRKNKP